MFREAVAPGPPPIAKPVPGAGAGAAVLTAAEINAQIAMRNQIQIQQRLIQQQAARQQAIFGINRNVHIKNRPVITGKTPANPLPKVINPLQYGYTSTGKKIMFNPVTKNFEAVLASVIKPPVPLDTFRFAFKGIRQPTYAEAVKYGGAPGLIMRGKIHPGTAIRLRKGGVAYRYVFDGEERTFYHENGQSAIMAPEGIYYGYKDADGSVYYASAPSYQPLKSNTPGITNMRVPNHQNVNQGQAAQARTPSSGLSNAEQGTYQMWQMQALTKPLSNPKFKSQLQAEVQKYNPDGSLKPSAIGLKEAPAQSQRSLPQKDSPAAKQPKEDHIKSSYEYERKVPEQESWSSYRYEQDNPFLQESPFQPKAASTPKLQPISKAASEPSLNTDSKLLSSADLTPDTKSISHPELHTIHEPVPSPDIISKQNSQPNLVKDIIEKGAAATGGAAVLSTLEAGEITLGAAEVIGLGSRLLTKAKPSVTNLAPELSPAETSSGYVSGRGSGKSVTSGRPAQPGKDQKPSPKPDSTQPAKTQDHNEPAPGPSNKEDNKMVWSVEKHDTPDITPPESPDVIRPPDQFADEVQVPELQHRRQPSQHQIEFDPFAPGENPAENLGIIQRQPAGQEADDLLIPQIQIEESPAVNPAQNPTAQNPNLLQAPEVEYSPSIPGRRPPTQGADAELNVAEPNLYENVQSTGVRQRTNIRTNPNSRPGSERRIQFADPPAQIMTETEVTAAQTQLQQMDTPRRLTWFQRHFRRLPHRDMFSMRHGPFRKGVKGWLDALNQGGKTFMLKHILNLNEYQRPLSQGAVITISTVSGIVGTALFMDMMNRINLGKEAAKAKKAEQDEIDKYNQIMKGRKDMEDDNDDEARIKERNITGIPKMDDTINMILDFPYQTKEDQDKYEPRVITTMIPSVVEQLKENGFKGVATELETQYNDTVQPIMQQILEQDPKANPDYRAYLDQLTPDQIMIRKSIYQYAAAQYDYKRFLDAMVSMKIISYPFYKQSLETLTNRDAAPVLAQYLADMYGRDKAPPSIQPEDLEPIRLPIHIHRQSKTVQHHDNPTKERYPLELLMHDSPVTTTTPIPVPIEQLENFYIGNEDDEEDDYDEDYNFKPVHLLDGDETKLQLFRASELKSELLEEINDHVTHVKRISRSRLQMTKNMLYNVRQQMEQLRNHMTQLRRNSRKSKALPFNTKSPEWRRRVLSHESLTVKDSDFVYHPTNDEYVNSENVSYVKDRNPRHLH